MENFKLKEKEKLVAIYHNIHVQANDNRFILTMFLTNFRLILFKDVNKELDYNTFLRTRMIEIPENNEVVFDLDLKEIKDIKYQNGFNIFTFLNNQNTLILKCDDLTKLISKKNV